MAYVAQGDLGPSFQPFATLREHFGYIPGLFRAQGLDPKLIQAETALIETLLLRKGALSRIQKECILLTLAGVHANAYCVSWHYQTLTVLGISEEKLDRILENHQSAGLQPANAALLDFGVKIGWARSPVSREDRTALHSVGLAEAQLLEAVQTMALGGFLRTLATGLGVEPDFRKHRLPARPQAKVYDLGAEQQNAAPYVRAIEDAPADFAPFSVLREPFGSVPDIFRLQISTPEALRAEADVVLAILSEGSLGRVQKVLVQLAVAATTGDTNQAWICDELLSRLGVTHTGAAPAGSGKALMAFAGKLADDGDEFSVADVEELRGSGFADAQILEAVSATALANFLNVLRLGLGVPQAATMPSRVRSLELAIAPKKAHLSVPEPRPIDVTVDPDAECVAQVRQGQLDAFEELMNRHHRRVYRTLVGVLGDTEEARDALQDTFLKAFQHLGAFEGRSKFSTWLVSIASNTAIQRLRERKPMESLGDPSSDAEEVFRPRQVQAWNDDPEQLYSQTELRSLVEQGVMRLPAKYRVVLMLRDLEQLPVEEAAAALELGIPAFKARLLRGRLMLREALAPHFVSTRSQGSATGVTG